MRLLPAHRPAPKAHQIVLEQSFLSNAFVSTAKRGGAGQNETYKQSLFENEDRFLA
jgi:hypothetical protein